MDTNNSWCCPKCGENHEIQFSSCWNCGGSIDGTPAPNFEKEIQQLDLERNIKHINDFSEKFAIINFAIHLVCVIWFFNDPRLGLRNGTDVDTALIIGFIGISMSIFGVIWALLKLLKGKNSQALFLFAGALLLPVCLIIIGLMK